MRLTLTLYNPPFINVDRQLWFNPAKLFPLVKILVDRFGREAVEAFGFLFLAYFGVDLVMMLLFEAIYLVLA